MKNVKIIVADDDKAIRLVLETALKRSGFEVTTTENAAGLWRLVQENFADLIITDVVMPDENAFDLIPKIRKVNLEYSNYCYECSEHTYDCNKSK